MTTFERMVESALGSGVRNQINDKLSKIGPYFSSIAAGNYVIAGTLDEFGLETVEAFTGFYGPSGTLKFDVRYSATGDPFTPGPDVPNTMLVVSWHKMQSGSYEVTAYLS